MKTHNVLHLRAWLDRVTIDQMNAISYVRWPEQLGGQHRQWDGTWGWWHLHSREFRQWQHGKI